MKQSLDKLSKIINKMIDEIESDLTVRNSKSNLKHSTDLLNKLLNIVTQLNKFYKEQGVDKVHFSTEQDQKIIENFLKRAGVKKCNCSLRQC